SGHRGHGARSAGAVFLGAQAVQDAAGGGGADVWTCGAGSLVADPRLGAPTRWISPHQGGGFSHPPAPAVDALAEAGIRRDAVWRIEAVSLRVRNHESRSTRDFRPASRAS